MTIPAKPSTHVHCPCCASTVDAWQPIVYGPISREVLVLVRNGTVVPGGMNHGCNEPQWQCKECETRFGRPKEHLDRFGRSLTGKRSATGAVAMAHRLFGRTSAAVANWKDAAASSDSRDAMKTACAA